MEHSQKIRPLKIFWSSGIILTLLSLVFLGGDPLLLIVGIVPRDSGSFKIAGLEVLAWASRKERESEVAREFKERATFFVCEFMPATSVVFEIFVTWSQKL